MEDIVFDPSIIYRRGLSDPKALTPEERFVYLVMDLETLADMEGWDHFFMYSSGGYLNELKAGLSSAGDTASLAVLEDYEGRFLQQGIAMEPEALEDFIMAQDDSYFANDRDWRDEFTAVIEERWKKIQQYLQGKGIHLLM